MRMAARGTRTRAQAQHAGAPSTVSSKYNEAILLSIINTPVSPSPSLFFSFFFYFVSFLFLLGTHTRRGVHGINTHVPMPLTGDLLNVCSMFPSLSLRRSPQSPHSPRLEKEGRIISTFSLLFTLYLN